MPWPAEHWGSGPTRRASSAHPARPGPVPWPRRHLRAVVGCEAVRAQLPLLVDGSRRLTPAVAEHLSRCLACQAEQASYRRLLKALRSLREEGLAPRPEQVARVLSALPEAPRRSFGPLVAVAAAGAAVVGAAALVAWGARRPRGLALSG